MALKKWDSGFAFSGNKITPDELGYDLNYIVTNPSISDVWFGTCAIAGTSAVKPLVVTNTFADYPRNLRCVLAGSADGMDGTFVINGEDQFGNSITESIAITQANNGGTTVGTKIFAKVISGTCNMGTAVGSGTTKVGCGTAGTTTLFGLPGKLGGTTDIKAITGSFTGVGTCTNGTFVFGGTPSSAADTAVHAFKAPLDVQAGTIVYNVRYRPSYPVFDETVKSA